MTSHTPAAASQPAIRRTFTGAIVFVLLAFFTIFEFYVAKNVDANILPLVGFAVVKAALILWYFMHLARSWRAQRGGH